MGSSALAQGNHQSQAKYFFIHIFSFNNGKRGKKGERAILDNFGQGKELEKWRKGIKNEKREQKFDW